jgi:regulatory protein
VAPNQRFSASGRNRRAADATPPDPRTARAAALALAARRDYTAAELERKLTDRGYDADTIATAIASLRESRVIDDRRVAFAHVRTARAIKGRGRVRIARELGARGLEREIIDEALGGIEPAEELTSIRRILTRKRWPAKPSRAERQRMFRHLFGRGFPADAIIKAMGGQDDDEDDDSP